MDRWPFTLLLATQDSIPPGEGDPCLLRFWTTPVSLSLGTIPRVKAFPNVSLLLRLDGLFFSEDNQLRVIVRIRRFRMQFSSRLACSRVFEIFEGFFFKGPSYPLCIFVCRVSLRLLLVPFPLIGLVTLRSSPCFCAMCSFLYLRSSPGSLPNSTLSRLPAYHNSFQASCLT